jgi:hypothetical protein
MRASLSIAFLSLWAIVVLPGMLGRNGDSLEETHDAAADR